jgi:4,5-dihydroxyphthalate decarboxylase
MAKVTRRKLLSTAGATAALASSNLSAQNKPRLTLACWDYDRTRSLMEGRVGVDGFDLSYLNLPVEETFFRMLRNHEFDASEMSLSSYVVSLSQDNPPFIAIPIFPSRYFRHSCIFVNSNSGIRRPEDLRGKRVGSPEYQMTAAVWIRGILSDEYKIPVSSTPYFTGGEEETGRSEKIALSLPSSIKVEPIGPDKTLAKMIESSANITKRQRSFRSCIP